MDFHRKINSVHLFKVPWYRVKNFRGILRCSFAVFACFLGNWWRYFLSLMNWLAITYSSVVNRSVPLDNRLFCEVHLFLIYLWHQNTWLPGRINLLLSLLKWAGEKQSPVRKKFLPRADQPMFHNMESFLPNFFQCLLYTSYCITAASVL